MMKPKAMKRGGPAKMMRGGMVAKPAMMPTKPGSAPKTPAMKRGGMVKKK